jgi:hypothetical protein
MALFDSVTKKSISRRRFLKTAALGSAGLAVYSSEIERHWLEVTQIQISLAGMPTVFEGMRIAQLSDIHMDEYTEPFFLHRVVDRINQLRPDIVLLTGDYVSSGLASQKYAIGAAWQCANILTGLECKRVFAVLGNHDVVVGRAEVTAALTANGITVLTNASANRARRRENLAGGSGRSCGGPSRPGTGYPCFDTQSASRTRHTDVPCPGLRRYFADASRGARG